MANTSPSSGKHARTPEGNTSTDALPAERKKNRSASTTRSICTRKCKFTSLLTLVERFVQEAKAIPPPPPSFPVVSFQLFRCCFIIFCGMHCSDIYSCFTNYLSRLSIPCNAVEYFVAFSSFCDKPLSPRSLCLGHCIFQ